MLLVKIFNLGPYGPLFGIYSFKSLCNNDYTLPGQAATSHVSIEIWQLFSAAHCVGICGQNPTFVFAGDHDRIVNEPGTQVLKVLDSIKVRYLRLTQIFR